MFGNLIWARCVENPSYTKAQQGMKLGVCRVPHKMSTRRCCVVWILVILCIYNGLMWFTPIFFGASSLLYSPSGRTSREASKPRDSVLDCFTRSEIWQATRQQRCRDACHISERCDQYKYPISWLRDLTRDRVVRRLKYCLVNKGSGNGPVLYQTTSNATQR